MKRSTLLVVLGLAVCGGSAGCASRHDASPRARAVTTSDGALASADPIGASLFARRSTDDSPRPMLATAPMGE